MFKRFKIMLQIKYMNHPRTWMCLLESNEISVAKKKKKLNNCEKLTNMGQDKEKNILTDGGNSGDYFSKFQFIQNGRFSSSIKANHKNSHLFFAKQALE